MKRISCLLLGVLVFVLPAAEATRGPSTCEERMQAVRFARSLEANPLALDSAQKRQWMNEFLVHVPDLDVRICGPVVGAPLTSANENYSRQLAWQYVYSSAAFMIEHPEVKDPVKIQTAGVEGTLKAYRSILRIDPDVRFKFLEDLLAKRDAGQLERYVATANSQCSDQSDANQRQLPPEFIH